MLHRKEKRRDQPDQIRPDQIRGMPSRAERNASCNITVSIHAHAMRSGFLLLVRDSEEVELLICFTFQTRTRMLFSPHQPINWVQMVLYVVGCWE